MPAETTDKSVSWASSDTTVLTVSQTGFCRAIGVGSSSVSVSTLDGSGLVATCVIQVADTVIPPTLAQSITLSQRSADLLLGDSLTLSCTILPLETSDKSFSWTCTDPSVLSLDTLGCVRAIGLDSASIIVTTLDGTNLSDTCTVRVSPIMAESLLISLTDTTLHVAGTFSLSCTVLPANTTNPAVCWTSSDSTIVSVDSLGFCTALSLGAATVTVSTLDGSNLSASCSVMVMPVLADSLAISASSLTLTIGDSALLTAQVFPADVTNPTVLFSSSVPSVVQVDNNGKISALSVGDAIITVSTADGSGLLAECLVTVEPIYVTSITLNFDSIALYNNNDSQTLIATVLPEDATFRTVEWSTSDSTVISVSQDGRVTGIREGTAIVYAASTDGSLVVASCPVRVKVWTDIRTILAADPDSLTIYDILGRRLSRIPAPGLYIINGKVTYVK